MELSEYLPSNNVAALIIASIIFIVTVALVARKVISFLITVVLLFFAIASGIAIANNDLVRQWMATGTQKEKTEQPVVKEEPKTKEQPAEETLSDIKKQLLKILEQLMQTIQKEVEPEKSAPEQHPDSKQTGSLETLQRTPGIVGERTYEVSPGIRQ